MLDKFLISFYFIWWTGGDSLIGKDREVLNMIDKAVGQYYDLETIVGNNNLNYISFSPHDLKQCKLKKYQYAKLVNINGLGIGQVHFITEDGHYLMLPWCYIVSMIPSKKNGEVTYGIQNKQKIR